MIFSLFRLWSGVFLTPATRRVSGGGDPAVGRLGVGNSLQERHDGRECSRRRRRRRAALAVQVSETELKTATIVFWSCHVKAVNQTNAVRRTWNRGCHGRVARHKWNTQHKSVRDAPTKRMIPS